jgi:aminomuconate-semialdehyde/2-hydroxymuconate-6-semialdehyde dehydrogenase
MTTIQNFIGGKFVSPESATYLDNCNPATGKVYSRIPDSDERDIDLAVTAAEAAAPLWKQTSIDDRSQRLHRLAELLEENIDEFALAESIDNGKPLALARSVDIPRAVSNFRFFASAIVNAHSETHHSDVALNYTLREPIGVVGCISPWNLPLYLFTWKIAPALAAGNAVIAKPSELTPMTAFMLAKLCNEAGLPVGVLNIVHGLGSKVGQAISAHPSISAISFTGGTATGKTIAATAAPMFKKLSLELGGKNPVIIFDDCNYDAMLSATVRSSFTNQGEICLCGSRIFIERTLYEKFKTDFVQRTKALKVGNPLEASSEQGAVVSEAHLKKILHYIDLAKSEGGTVLCGGERVRLGGECADGWFMAPTVIEGLSPQCRTNQEEIFGPVVTLMPFDTADDAVAAANATPYGLASVVWTENLTRAHRIAAALKSGIVWINCWMLRDLRTPFGGMKHSGVGREGGTDALRFFTEAKNVCVKL